MAANNLESTNQPMIADVIGNFLAAPPAGTPPELLESFSLMLRNGGSGLPPHLFQEVVDQAPVAVSVTDRKANILYANHAFERLTGYDRREAVGKNESLLSNKTTPESVYQNLWQTISASAHWSGVLVNRRKDGSEYLAELDIAPVLDREGRVSHYLGMHRDITEVDRLQRENGYQKELFQSVLNAAPVVVALLDTQQRVILENQEYQRLKSDLGGEPFAVFRRALEEQAELSLSVACELGRPFRNQEVRLDQAGGAGPRWFSCSGAWVCGFNDAVSAYFSEDNQAQPCLLLLANEITARKREVERARLQHLRAVLAEQQLAEGMREALAAAVFQLQGPLNVIEAATRMLDSGGGDPASLRGMLSEILNSGRKTLETMQAVLPETVVEAQNSVNLNEILHEVIQLVTERLLVNGIVIDWRPEAVVPAVSGVGKQLRGLFKYLMDNAIRALEGSRSNAREIRILTCEEDGLVMVEIQDNGPGIPREEQIKVFEPFYSAWRHGEKGAGMGLALAREIANRHGGGLTVDPDFEDGCRVRVELPGRGSGL